MSLRAVAGIIHGVSDKCGRHELHVPQRPGPGARHRVRRDVPFLDNLKRVQQLRPEEMAAPLVVGQRRQRIDHTVAAQIVAKIRLQSPEGDDIARRHTVLGMDFVQQVAMGCQQRPTRVFTRLIADALAGGKPRRSG